MLEKLPGASAGGGSRPASFSQGSRYRARGSMLVTWAGTAQRLLGCLVRGVEALCKAFFKDAQQVQ